MDAETLELAIIGAGAAGLHAARAAADGGIGFEIFDDHERVGDEWRQRYRSLRLFTPRRWLDLPGMHIDIGFFEYPTADQLADYLERYASANGFAVRTSTRVVRLTRHASGHFLLELSGGGEVTARQVIVATGAHHIPVVPAFAEQLDPRIRQIHSLDYRDADDLAPGPVLVVGAGNSGTDIALEAVAAGHATTISGRVPGQVPGRIDTPIGNLIAGVAIRRLRGLTMDTARGRRFRAEHAGHGVNLVRNHIGDLTRAGVRHVGRIESVREGAPALADGELIESSTIVWCTGSRPRLHWIDIPAAFGPDGMPAHERGVATAVPGLGFVGLPFLYSVASPTLMGMGRDARHLIEHLGAALVPA